MDELCKRSGQIPAFGDWEYANDLPITQYFECARQAGLIRYSSSSGDSDPHVRGDLYAINVKKSSHRVPPSRKTSGGEKRCPRVKEHKRQGKVCDVTEPPRKPSKQLQRAHDDVPPPMPTSRLPKPVDEDLYKIPADLLQASKRKKRLGFFSRCLVPACAA